MNRLLLFLLCLLPWLHVQAQTIVRIDSLPAAGVLLDRGWKWHAGDSPAWARPDADDSKWASIDPTKDIFELPQIPKTGKIVWLRLRLVIDTALHQPLVLMIQQAGASELYLNGKRIHRFGVVSAATDQIRAFNPRNSPVSLPVSTNGVQVLAIRYAFQPNIRYATHFGSSNLLFMGRLRPADKAVSDYTNDYGREQNQDLTKTAVFAIISLLFFTLFVFFPVRKAHLYFSVYALLFAVSWYIISFLVPPHFVETAYGIKNAVLILQTIGYLFMLNAVYATFQYKKGFFYWAMVLSGIVAMLSGAFVYGWGWMPFGFFFTNFISVDIIRVSTIAVRQHRKGAWILLAGCICYLICWFFFTLQFSGVIAVEGLLTEFLFNISLLSIPVSFAVFLAYDFGLTNRVLLQKLKENQTLSAEKQQILATQNETLEKQVAERTAELEHKNHDLEIEAALDKVRSRSLAMHSSDELQEVVIVVFEKLKELGLVFDGGAGIQLFTENSKDSILWIAAPSQMDTPSRINLPYDADDFRDNPIILDVWKAKESGEAIYNKIYTREEKNSYFDYVFKHNDLIQIPQLVRDEIMQASSYTQAFVVEKNSGVIANRWSGEVFPPDKFDVFKRIARVFDQAYIRFLDLQKAEAQAREAQIEVALERVRSRTMSMQHSDELAEVISILCKGILNLGIHSEEMETCYITTFDQNKPIGELYLTYSNGDLIPQSFQIDYDEDPLFKHIYTEWKRKNTFIVDHISGDALIQHFDFLFSHVPASIIETRALEPTKLPIETFTHAVFFSQGYLSIVTRKAVPEYHEVFKRFGNTLQQAYTRFLDLQNAEAQAEQARLDLILIQIEKKRAEDALAELHITQTQLIQKEKLASLGELTAGIAHEIQNPLNFVNNFAQVSSELVDELKGELTKGDTAEATILADDLSQNLQKIAHHGSRASSIVRGMLEHSRTSTGERQPTDLNALCDEYLRLAYQGQRRAGGPARDKPFTCELATDFAPALPPISMVAPDIGRVLLNLFSNAFYATQQRTKQGESGYKPTLRVNTKRTPTGICIRISDNGTGIPDEARAKIFQPFFTTKPTGEGTGLGLSLSYDIVTKGHGGTIEVESQVGKGTAMTVWLPVAS